MSIRSNLDSFGNPYLRFDEDTGNVQALNTDGEWVNIYKTAILPISSKITLVENSYHVDTTWNVSYTTKEDDSYISMNASKATITIFAGDDSSAARWVKGHLLSNREVRGNGKTVYITNTYSSTSGQSQAVTLCLKNVETGEFKTLGSIASSGSKKFTLPTDGERYIIAIYGQAYSYTTATSTTITVSISDLYVE